MNVAEQLEVARNAILESDFEKAATACRLILEAYPKHIDAACLLAEAYREQGHNEKAEGLFRRVLSADPESILANWALGLILRDRQAEDEALTHLRCAHELAPNNPELLNDLRTVARDRRSLTEPSRAQLGRWYAASGHYRRAVEEFRAVLASEPERMDIWVALAEALWRNGSVFEAEEVCRAILAEAPDCLKPLLILADLLKREQGDPAEMEAVLAVAKQLDPAGSMQTKLD